jgi:UDP-N-acetylmuramate dehydrogenase
MFMEFENTRVYNILHPHFQGRVRCQEPLSGHSSFGVGGPADLWLSLQSHKEVRDLICLCTEYHWPLLVVGEGSNILYADAGVRGIVAHMALQSYHIEEPSDNQALVITEAGLHWAQLLHDLVPRGWGGLEFGSGIPGTLGAGVVSNAGAHNQDLGQALEWVEVQDARGCNIEEEGQLTPPLLRRYFHDELDLGYRHSRFREQRRTHIDAEGHLVLSPRGLIEPPEIIVKLGLRLHRQDPQILRTLVEKQQHDRQQIDPAHQHRGSIFKDPPEATASELIKQAGLCGRTCGNAQISQHNGNYLVNLGGACAMDMINLIREAHHQVLIQVGISLTLNVELLGEWSVERT